MKKNYNKEASGVSRWGFLTGKLMGRVVTKMDRGLESLEKLSLGQANDFLKLAADAVSAVVQKVQTITTKPFALSLKDGFAQEAAEGAKKPASTAQMRRSNAPPKPAGPKLAPA